MTKEQFLNSPLDPEEQWYEDHSEEFVASEDQTKLREQLKKAAHNTLEELRKRKPVTINLDSGVIAYFKELSEETGVPYQTLINMYLVQCANEKKRPVFA